MHLGGLWKLREKSRIIQGSSSQSTWTDILLFTESQVQPRLEWKTSRYVHVKFKMLLDIQSEYSTLESKKLGLEINILK